jgi:tyrosyl-tRNA synthetase
LDANKTSVYKFYQFWVRVDDRDVIRYLKYFTFLTQPEIEALALEHQTRPEARVAHKALAKAVTDLLHGPAATQDAIRASEILFGGELSGISEAVFNDVIGEVPTKALEQARLEGAGLPLVEALVQSGLASSKGQARKDIEGGGVYLNNVRETNFQRPLTSSDLLFQKHFLVRKGKKNYVVLTVQ